MVGTVLTCATASRCSGVSDGRAPRRSRKSLEHVVFEALGLTLVPFNRRSRTVRESKRGPQVR